MKRRKAGFTLTEFLVLIGAGSLLAGLLLADLTQTKTKFFQQACAGNLKQWGLAINLYSQDYGGTYYGSNVLHPWDDSGPLPVPYSKYICTTNIAATMRNLRVCPFIASLFSQDQINNSAAGHSYSMPDYIAVFGGSPVYRIATGSGAPSTSPYKVLNAQGVPTDLPSLKGVPHPSQFLLLMDYGNSMSCGQLYSKSVTVPSSGPAIKPCDRHGGNVNCLFGDFHVELVSTQALAAVDATGGCVGTPTNGTPNPWFSMN